MDTPQSPTELTVETRFKVPNGTAMAEYGDAIVVTGPTGTRTLSGEAAQLSGDLLAASDGQTPLGDVVPAIGDEATALAIAERLSAAGLVYPVELLDGFDVDDNRLSLLETLLLGLDADSRPGFADRVRSLTVGLHGEPSTTGQLGDAFGAFGCTTTDSDPDVLVFVEGDATTDREAVNRAWLDSDATLVRAAVRGTEVEIGPVLSPSSESCLACLTTREELNDAGRELTYRSLAPGPTYETELCSHVLTRLTLRAGLARLPADLVGRLFRFDLRTLDYGEARLFGVPGCDACDGRD
ncbi:TOMM precursor leader peptide-binding protein [Haloarcula sp. S1CR25-12]|uniref:TOMM leader peptide-binding protein n=1 Tax=Haloarcula saliterrae TaxID=2950534 RepID=A0ABU2F7J3_9EURY|nr:TOMM precursor leader peptide-binding protein [Haloarcula sp. S1CR25-12]MDS0258209.1 TOMM precursor leader peptide-binding protein [Haloarcula sp. S1CR25-12]